MALVGSREKALFSRSLAPILAGIVGHSTTIDLRNGLSVVGHVIAVDCYLNVTIQNGTMIKSDGRSWKLEVCFLHRKSIRNVIIPDHLPLEFILKDQLDTLQGVKRKKERLKRTNYLKNRKNRRSNKANT